MSSEICVRSYKVGFGDCTLVSFPDGKTQRHILIDFGSAPGPAGYDANFQAIAENIRDETNNHLDVVVVTHEHRDHLNGFHAQKKIFDGITIDSVWMGLPSKPDYEKSYATWYKPKLKNLLALRGLRDDLRRYNETLKTRRKRVAQSLQTVIDNNLPSDEELACVRALQPDKEKVLYLCRERESDALVRKQFSKKVRVRILAPQADACACFEESYDWTYLALLRKILASVGSIDSSDRWQFPQERPKMLDSPKNLMSREWARLRGTVADNSPEAICEIDNNTNNMSLVFTLEIGGRRLLFAGDAAAESWAWMDFNGDLKRPVDFLKVPHHGNQKCMSEEILDRILPVARKKNATAVVSTRSNVYGTAETIPNEKLLTSLRSRSRLLSTETDGDALWVDVRL